ncbi:MAG TPA: DUF5398 family protein [Chlamydiales bacterium]|nr:DUF5398 family protein [Chlamydiales bacterium]
MFGLEKDKPRKDFDFDLEKEIHKDPERAQEILKLIEEKQSEIKTAFREGRSQEETEKLETIFEAYAALKKIVERVKKA